MSSNGAVVEPLPASTTFRDVLPTLAGKTWFISRLDEAGRRQATATLDGILDGTLRGDAGNLGDLTPRDPRGVGVRGAYPQINEGLPNQSTLLRMFVRFAYRRSAIARYMVDSIASMVWGEWVRLVVDDQGSERLKEALEEVFRNPTGRPGERPLYWWIERTYRLARRDGRALLYFALQDQNSQNPALPPVNVKRIVGLTTIRQENIQKAVLGTDPMDPDTYGRVTGWQLTLNADGPLGKAGSVVTVHADRVQAFIPYPTEEDPNDGESIVAQNINYVEMMENLLWASAEAYFTEASPYIVVSLDKDVKLGDQERQEVKAQINNIQQASTQRLFLRGVTVSVLAGSGTLANPTPHWEVGMQALAFAMGGIPVSIMTGNQTGKTTAANEDSSRVQALISKIQEQDADPALSSIVHRFQEWGIESWELGDANRIKFEWNKLFEPNPKEAAETQLALANARQIYQAMKQPLPDDLGYDAGKFPDWPPGTEPPAPPTPPPMLMSGVPPQAPPGAPPPPAAPAAKPEEAAAKGDVARLNVHVDATIRKAERRLRAALKPAYAAVEAHLARRHATGDARGFRRRRSVDDSADEAAKAVNSPETRGALQDAILATFRDALEAGALHAFDALNIDRAYNAMQSTRYAAFKTLSGDLADVVATRLADRVRASLSEGLANGESLHQLRKRVEEDYGATKADAERIARTESMRAFNAGNLDAFQAAGVERWRWRAYAGADAGDPDGECVANDGHVFSMTDPAPPEASHPNCRCYPEPVLPGE